MEAAMARRRSDAMLTQAEIAIYTKKILLILSQLSMIQARTEKFAPQQTANPLHLRLRRRSSWFQPDSASDLIKNTWKQYHRRQFQVIKLKRKLIKHTTHVHTVASNLSLEASEGIQNVLEWETSATQTQMNHTELISSISIITIFWNTIRSRFLWFKLVKRNLLNFILFFLAAKIKRRREWRVGRLEKNEWRFKGLRWGLEWDI